MDSNNSGPDAHNDQSVDVHRIFEPYCENLMYLEQLFEKGPMTREA